MSKLIVGESSPWTNFYDPGRISLSAAGNFVMENLTAVKNFAEYVAPGELGSIEELQPGKGAIIREGCRKWQPIAMKAASFIAYRQRARMLAAICTGIRWSDAGIVHVMDRISRSMVCRSMHLR